MLVRVPFKMLPVIVLVVALLASANGAKILGIFATPSYSHQIVYQPIWKELSLRGHQVTVLTPNPLNDPTLVNLTEIDLSFSYNIWSKFSVSSLGSKEHSTSEEIRLLSEAYHAITEAQLQHPSVQPYVNNTNNEEYDLILVEFLWPLMYGFKDVYKCPMVGITSIGLVGSGYDAVGNPNHPSLNPDVTLPFSTNLSFKERVISTLFQFLYKTSVTLKLYPRLNKIAQNHFGNIQPVQDLAREVSLVIVNSNLAIRNPKPLVPAYKEISGIHIQPPKPLPQDIQTYLDNAKEGVIYFSLGSNVKSSKLPEEKINQLLATFAELPYKVLWKFEKEDLSNKPSNVEIRKWLPQQDVLRHPNIKVFITQGGLQSLDEAVHTKVPVLIIPFFGDQRYNAHLVENKGYGLSLNFLTFTSNELKDKINKLITDPTYKKTMETMSKIATDQPMSALETAMWWIEYVIRHDGAPHLRYAAVDMPFYQYYLIDVYASITAAFLLILYVLMRACKPVILFYNKTKRLLISTATITEKSHKE